MRYFKMVQVLLFIGIALVAFYFSVLLGKTFLSYFFLSSQTKAHVFQWEVLEINDKYPIKASYSFEVDGKMVKNSFIFPKPWSWNQASALALVRERAQQSWMVWYNPNNPECSALEKRFPYNLFFRSLICYAVLVYFYLFRRKFLTLYNY